MKGFSKNILLVLIFGLVIAVIIPSFAGPSYSADDFFTKLISSKTDLTFGEAIFEIKNPTSNDITILTEKFSFAFQKTLGNDIESYEIYYNASVKNGLESTQCINDSKSSCFEVNNTIYSEEWRELSTKLTFLKDQAMKIKIVAFWKPHLGPQSIDWIPSLNITGTIYKQNKWAWWNSSWLYKKAIAVNITNNTDLYQINLSIPYNAHMNTNFSDLRFIDKNDSILYDYWIQNKTDSSFAYIWVEGNFTNANGTQIYMYYGNTAAGNLSNIGATMLFGDDFDDSSVNWTTKWVNQTTGSGMGTVESSGYLNQTQTATGSTASQIWSNTSTNYSSPYIYEAYVVQDQVNNSGGANTNQYIYFGTRDTYPGSGNWWTGDVVEWLIIDGGSATWIDYWDTGSANETTKVSDFQSLVGPNLMDFKDHIYSISVNSTNASFRYNNSIVSEPNIVQFTTTGVANLPDEPVRPFMFAGTSGTAPPVAFWCAYDWVFIRKYLYNEPVYSIGSEETSSTCTIANNTVWALTCSDNCTINGGAYNVTNVTTTGSGYLTFNNTNFTFNTFFLSIGCNIAINTSNSRFMRSPYS